MADFNTTMTYALDETAEFTMADGTTKFTRVFDGKGWRKVKDADNDTVYTAGTNVAISNTNVISSTDTNTVYSHPTSAGNKHIPTSGSSGQFLKYSASGTAVWSADNNDNTTYTAGTNVAISNTNVISSTDTNTVYSHPTSAGNKHVPSGGSSGKFLKWSSAGTAVWSADNNDNTTYSAGTNVAISNTNVISSTDTDTVYSHPTSAGNKHVPSGGSSGQFLKYTSAGTAVWSADNNDNTTYSEFTGTTAGLVPTSTTTDDTKFLRADGTWVVPTDTNTDTDTNTWRGIQDNLTSTSTTDSLSAKQGTTLKALLDGHDHSGTYVPYNYYKNFGSVSMGSTVFTSSATFITKLEQMGMFDQHHSVAKVNWNYSGNANLKFTEVVNLINNSEGLETAGCVIETFTDDSSDYYSGGARGNITVRVTRPNTGAGSHVTLVYNDQGSDYSPGWHKENETYHLNVPTGTTYPRVNMSKSFGADAYVEIRGAGSITATRTTDNIITLTGTDTNTDTHRSDESVRDVTAAQLVGGTNVTITEDDTANTLTITATDTDTNTWRSISDSVTSTSTTVSASSKAVKTVNDRVDALSSIRWTGLTAGMEATADGLVIRRPSADGGGSWDHQIYSVEKFKGDVFISFRMKELDTGANHTMIGFDTNPSQGNNYNTIDYAWYVNNGSINVYENGSSFGVGATWNTDSIYSIARAGSNVRYYQDGVLKRTVDSHDNDLYVDTSFHSSIEIRDIRMGQVYIANPPDANTTKYLRADGSWEVPTDTNTVYSHPTGNGNKHIPSNGSSGQFLKYSSSGTAVWASDNNTTYSNFSGTTAGLVPTSTATDDTKFLRADGEWVVPTDTDTNTVYSHPIHNGDDFSVDTGLLSGATVVSDIDINITTNTFGHVTDANGYVATRTLTLEDLSGNLRDLDDVSNGNGGSGWFNLGLGGSAVGTSFATPHEVTGAGNIGVSYYSLAGVTLGDYNCAIGMASLMDTTTGSYNTAVGNGAGARSVVGNNNTFVGYNAGYENIGNGNVLIGHSAGDQSLASNKLFIANTNTTTPLIGGDFNAGTVTINGALTATGNITAYSDERIKENITEVPNALDAVDAIRGVTYTRTDTKEDSVGVIAQEVEALFPELVTEHEDGIKSVNYNGLIGVLFSAVKELSAEVKALKEQK